MTDAGRRVPVGYDSAERELILGWRKSALFLKSPLSERQQAASSDFFKNGFSRIPAA